MNWLSLGSAFAKSAGRSLILFSGLAMFKRSWQPAGATVQLGHFCRQPAKMLENEDGRLSSVRFK